MTAMTINEVSSEDVPVNVLSGTSKRRVKIYLRSATTDAGGASVDLSTYVSGLADIEGIGFASVADAVSATAMSSLYTWSTTTLTATGAGTADLCIFGTMT